MTIYKNNYCQNSPQSPSRSDIEVEKLIFYVNDPSKHDLIKTFLEDKKFLRRQLKNLTTFRDYRFDRSYSILKALSASEFTKLLIQADAVKVCLNILSGEHYSSRKTRLIFQLLTDFAAEEPELIRKSGIISRYTGIFSQMTPEELKENQLNVNQFLWLVFYLCRVSILKVEDLTILHPLWNRMFTEGFYTPHICASVYFLLKGRDPEVRDFIGKNYLKHLVNNLDLDGLYIIKIGVISDFRLLAPYFNKEILELGVIPKLTTIMIDLNLASMRSVQVFHLSLRYLEMAATDEELFAQHLTLSLIHRIEEKAAMIFEDEVVEYAFQLAAKFREIFAMKRAIASK